MPAPSPSLPWCLRLACCLKVVLHEGQILEKPEDEAQVSFFPSFLPACRCLPDSVCCTSLFLNACP